MHDADGFLQGLNLSLLPPAVLDVCTEHALLCCIVTDVVSRLWTMISESLQILLLFYFFIKFSTPVTSKAAFTNLNVSWLPSVGAVLCTEQALCCVALW